MRSRIIDVYYKLVMAGIRDIDTVPEQKEIRSVVEAMLKNEQGIEL